MAAQLDRLRANRRRNQGTDADEQPEKSRDDDGSAESARYAQSLRCSMLLDRASPNSMPTKPVRKGASSSLWLGSVLDEYSDKGSALRSPVERRLHLTANLTAHDAASGALPRYR